MRKSYEKQILDHNVDKFSLIVRDDIDMFFSIKTLTEANKNTALQVNSISGAKKNYRRFEMVYCKRQAYKAIA